MFIIDYYCSSGLLEGKGEKKKTNRSWARHPWFIINGNRKTRVGAVVDKKIPEKKKNEVKNLNTTKRLERQESKVK